MARVLVIEDDETTAREIVAELSVHGMTAEWIANGREGLERACQDGYDLITLDRMLPGMDGIDVVAELRRAQVDTPVLMISALSDVDERVRGLRAGGDDYLTKPFAPDEMAARAEVLLRRRQPQAVQRLRVANLELDLVSHVAYRDGQPLTLLPTEYRLLEFLMRNSGQVLTRSMIFETVWGFHFDPGTNVIDVHIARLRRKIDTAGQPPLIHTVRGTGYMLTAAQETASVTP
ncbi:response regulator transcription factor [Dyella jiangningensis]|uniref:DNA-binding response regulator n=1 Tax=Dyella jiangningensis TaxID=1379159 RepID=A0A328P6H6_9GAMM|nr:response regulator transcription factor [Dyella jiangningensis]RAO75854.1 DNA-binding response regulator [Dyella jiangningensis]